MDLFYYVIYLICYIITQKTTLADILVYNNNNQLMDEFRDLPARFGWQLPTNGLKVNCIMPMDDYNQDGCSNNLTAPPDINDPKAKWAILIKRYNCTFEEKVRNAQLAGYDAVIVYNVGSNDLEQMSAKNDDDIMIPSVFVGESTGHILRQNFMYADGFALLINDDLPFNINTHLILPFSIVVGLCFFIMIGFMIVKCVRERRRLRRYRLPRSILKRIPTIKFNKSLPYDTCVICLDDYIDGDKLRILPCNHAYHCKCIDHWLTKNRRVCPMCKRNVHRRPRPQPEHRGSDYSSDSDADDTTPLINPVENSNSNHGTFNRSPEDAANNVSESNQQQPRDNPFDRTPNIPQNNAEAHTNSSIWSAIKRAFQWNSSIVQNTAPVDGITDVEEQSAVISIHSNSNQQSTGSRNNLLNDTVSGSLRNTDETGEYCSCDDDDDDDDVNNEPTTTIYQPIYETKIENDRSQRQVGSSQSRLLGVAALPNTEFTVAGSSNGGGTQHQPQRTNNNDLDV